MWFIKNAINGIITIGIVTFVVTIIELKFDFPWEPFILVVVLIFLTACGISNLKKTLFWVWGCITFVSSIQAFIFSDMSLKLITINILFAITVSLYLCACQFIMSKYLAVRKRNKSIL